MPKVLRSTDRSICQNGLCAQVCCHITRTRKKALSIFPYICCLHCQLFSLCRCYEYRSTYTYCQHQEYEYERADGSNLDIFVYEHLHTDEHQQHAHAYLQIAELVGYSSQQEEEGTQAENGEDVGEEHYVGVERHREDGWYAVEYEYQVAELYEDYGEHKRSKVEVLVEKSHHGMVHGVYLLLLVAVQEHLHAAVQQEHTEHEQYPFETADEGSTGKDEDEAQHDGSQNAPVERMLILLLVDAERCEYHHHHEEVVYRQRLLYQIARYIRYGHIVAILLQTRLKVVGIELQMRSIACRNRL